MPRSPEWLMPVRTLRARFSIWDNGLDSGLGGQL